MARGSGYQQPHGWDTIRERILKRDGHRCGCGRAAVSVDHIISVASYVRAGLQPDHADANLRAICADCKRAKDEADRLAGIAAQPRARRPAERHPGLR